LLIIIFPSQSAILSVTIFEFIQRKALLESGGLNQTAANIGLVA
jgi:hypothetical protein